MKISVQRFKSIDSVKNFKIEKLSILAGANSSGKSSLTQSLLLIKQTLESSSDDVLYLQGPYVQARQLSDLIHKRSAKGFSLDMEWNREELSLDKYSLDKYLSEGARIEDLALCVTFKNIDDRIQVVDFSLKLKGDKSKAFMSIHWNTKSKLYELETDILQVYEDVKAKTPQAKKLVLKECKVDFLNFCPVFVNTSDVDVKRRDFALMVNKDFRTLLLDYVNRIYYIGPNRVSPVLDRMYQMNQNGDQVDADGYNTRYILVEKKSVMFGEKTLSAHVNEWIEYLGLADGLTSLKDSKNQYRTEMIVKGNMRVDLCNTGFGNSQILPILVQGIMTPTNGIFIVEDPEVHIHPSVQAGMADFFISMAREGKTVIVETHSDHIITRLRRRVSEEKSVLPFIHIYFVENTNGCSDYIALQMNENADFKDMGILPKGFMDSQDDDFREIVKNKMRSMR